MSTVLATITTSVDGYVTGPDDREGCGLGVGGERLHYWVMGGPWTYEDERAPGEGMSGVDEEYMGFITEGLAAGICGRGMYEASGRWGGTNPFGGTLVVLTHRTEDAPDPCDRVRVRGRLRRRHRHGRRAAGDKGVAICGGADTIRQALRAGVVDRLAISTAPVVLGAGKRLFEGFERDVELEMVRVFASPLATTWSTASGAELPDEQVGRDAGGHLVRGLVGELEGVALVQRLGRRGAEQRAARDVDVHLRAPTGRVTVSRSPTVQDREPSAPGDLGRAAGSSVELGGRRRRPAAGR